MDKSLKPLSVLRGKIAKAYGDELSISAGEKLSANSDHS